MAEDNTSSWSTDSFIEEAYKKFTKELEREIFRGPTDEWKGFYIAHPGPRPRQIKFSVRDKEVTRTYGINKNTREVRLISIDWNI